VLPQQTTLLLFTFGFCYLLFQIVDSPFELDNAENLQGGIGHELFPSYFWFSLGVSLPFEMGPMLLFEHIVNDKLVVEK
jgi:hypothetical protein